MYFSFGFKSSILLLFFVHGIVFSVLLAIKGFQHEDKSSYWLSFFSFLCSMYIAPFMFGYAGWYSQELYRTLLFYIPFQQLFLLPVVLYFYCRYLLDNSFRFSKKHRLHFVPAVLYLLYALLVFLNDRVLKGTYYFYEDGKDKDFATWYQVAGLLMLVYYLLKCLQTYKQYKRITYNEVSYADSVMFKWARRFLLAFLVLIAIRVLFFLVNPEWDAFGRKFWYYLSFSVLFYYVTISGYANSILTGTSLAGRALPLPNPPPAALQVAEIDEETLQSRSSLPDLVEWKQKIERLMEEEKLYENPVLILSDLSSRLGTHTKKVSQVINDGFQMNFNDFVNAYRIEAVIRKIEEGEHTVQTLLALAYEAGFNSKSTFNRAFKRAKSISPKEYIEKYHQK
ncbi:MAG: AraC family transcriptional regulator [Flavihumibacter sp. CACIAM 22H1]|nr:MAG: AraC family transcriptional regulator [Flavihumibacter sp. CACIAM 22H1]